jgi:FkbM family methyltransferase
VDRGYSLRGNRIFFWFSAFVETMSQEEKFLRRIDLKGKTVYDVGAHIGTKTLFFAKKVGLKGQVVAFEPNPEGFAHLLSNTRRAKNVQALNIGLGCKSTETVLVSSSFSTATGSLDPRAQRFHMGRAYKEWRIPIRRLDDLQNLPPPDFVKIDVEGYEYQVILGMTKTITKYRPAFFVELHGVGPQMKMQNAERIIQFLTTFRYKVFHVETRQSPSWDKPPLEGHILAFGA